MAIYRFPSNLDTGEGKNHVSFQVVDDTSPEFEKIHLYVQQGFNTSDSASYGNVDLGAINALQSFATSEKSLSGDDATVAGLKVIEKLTGEAGLNAKVALEKKIAFNPQTALAFESVGVRSFSFDFKLVPESEQESEIARAIENIFRKYLYPKKSGEFTLRYPPKWRIRFMSGENDNKYMPFIQDCYLVGFDATHNSEGNSFFANGAPTAVDMKLSFTETKIMTRSDLYPDNGYDYTYSRPEYATASTSGENS